MIRVDIRGMAEVQAMLRNLASEQIPYATMITTNNLAFKTLTAEKEEMQASFDRPTPFILKSMWVEKATKTKLTAVLEANRSVGAGIQGNAWNRILQPHVEGIPRRWRSAEHRLNIAGLLPDGWFAVPAPDAPLDQYGNLPGSWWMMILSWMNAAQWSSQGATQNRIEKVGKRKNVLERAGVEMFPVVPGRSANRHLKPGIYLRQAKNGFNVVKPVLLFVNSVQYAKRLDWYGAAQRCVDENFAEEATKAIQRAIDTAR